MRVWYNLHMRKALMILLLCSISVPAQARDPEQWHNSPANVRQWFQNLMQPDNAYVSCCGEADAFEADVFESEGDHYVAIITDGKGEVPDGMRIQVPNSKLKWDSGNPTGHGIIFLSTHNPPAVLCYVTPPAT